MKPFRLVKAIRDVADDPDGIVRLVGLAVMLKSGGAGWLTVML